MGSAITQKFNKSDNKDIYQYRRVGVQIIKL